MASTDQTVRVFISSTFRDMHAERDHLVTVVFPELRERVERLGLEFFDVDLRWGVPAKDANGETANSWEYCRQWIDRVEPFFVCILGQRYGWEPDPEQLKDPDDRQRQQAQKRSITDMEVRHAVLDTKLIRRSYFYLRADEVPASASEFVDPLPLLDKLKQMKDEVRSCGRPVRTYPCRWTGEGFAEMEEFGRLVLDDLWSGILRDSRYVSKDVWRQALGTDPDTDPLYTDESELVPRELWEKVVALAKPEPKEPLDAEREQMDAFAEPRLRWFQGRTHEISLLTSFLNDPATNAPRLAVVAAVPGQGKSALLARSHQQLRDSPHFVITHFVGATERSASAHSLVQRLLDELDRSGIAWPAEQQEGEEPKRDFNSLCLRLAQRLGEYRGERRIVLLLDALNQLSDGHDLHWLPYRLGPSVRVIVSCIEDIVAKADSPEQRVLQALASHRPEPLRVKLGPLTEEDVRTIVVAYLDEYCKVLDTAQVDAICELQQVRNPLYLLAMLGELRTLGGNDMNRIVGELIASMPQDHPDTMSLFRWVLRRLEVFGQSAVQWWCLYLAHGRVGMSSHELADLLARKLGPEAAATALLIERGLRRYLQRRGAQLDFFHGQLRQAVFLQYAPHAESATVHSDVAAYLRDHADPEKDQSWKGDNPRPFLELVFHLANSQQFDELCGTLCDLRFVEARCRQNQVFDLIADYRLAYEHLPEAQDELRTERERQVRLNRWTLEITEYSRQWSERLDRLAKGEAVTEPEPSIPEPPPTVISAEARQNKRGDWRFVDRIAGWNHFVANRTAILAARELPVFPIAWNYADGGPVADEMELLRGSGRGYEGPWLRLLKRPVHVPQPPLHKTLHGHRGSIRAVALNANGDVALSAGDDSYVRVWNVPAGLCVNSLAGHKSEVLAAAMTPDGNWAISSGKDRSALIWNLIAGDCAQTFTGHTGPVKAVALTADGRFGLTTDGREIRMWDCRHGNAIQLLKPDADYPGYLPDIKALAISPDGRFAASGSDLGNVRLWDLVTARCVSANGQGYFSADELCSICCVCFRTIPNDIIATVPSKGIYFMSMDATTRYQEPIKEDAYSAQSCALTADGTHLVVGRGDHAVSVWDLKTQECVLTLRGHTDSVTGVAVSADGEYAVSGSLDGTVRVWGLREVSCPTAGLEQYGTLENIGINEGGRNAVSVDLGGRIHRWDTETGELIASRQISSDPITAVAFAENSHHALLSILEPPVPWDETSIYDLERNSLVFANLKSGASLLRYGHHRSYDAMALCNGGHSAVLMESDRLILWNMERDERIRLFEDSKVGRLTSFAVSPDCQLLISGCGISVSGGGDHCIRVWDLVKGGLLAVMTGHTDTVLATTVTSDGRFALSGSVDRTIRVWSLRTKQCVLVLGPHSSSVISMAASPDAQDIAAGCKDGSIYLWDLTSGEMLLKGFSHKGAVRRISAVQNRLVIGAIPSSLEFYEIENALWNRKPTFITATRRWAIRDDSKKGEWDNDYTVVCELCGALFIVSQAIAETIMDITRTSEVLGDGSPCLALPNEAWEDRRLLSICPHCHNSIRYNPFLDNGRER